MSVINKDRILNGTDHKRLFHAYETLKNQYSDDMARDYRKYYYGKPISFIMENARYIIAEPQFGLPFIEWVSTSFPISYSSLKDLKNCVGNYVKEHGDRMGTLKNSYESLYQQLNDLLDERSTEAIVESTYIKEDDTNSLIDSIYGLLCRKRFESGDESAVKFFKDVNYYIRENGYFESCISNASHISKIIYLTPYAKEMGLEDVLTESYLSLIYKESDNQYEVTSSNLIACETMQLLSKSNRFMEAVNSFSNMNLRVTSKGMINTNIASEIIRTYEESVKDTIHLLYDSPNSAVNAIMEESVYDEIYREEREETRKNLLSMKHAIYESVRRMTNEAYMTAEDTNSIFIETPLFTAIKESIGITDPLTVEKALLLINEAVSSIEANMEENSFFERMGDGTANRAIRRTHTMFREDLPSRALQDNSSKKKQSNVVDEDNQEDDEDEESSEDYNAPLPKSTRVASSDLPDSSNPNATKPTKPKQGILKKIQAKGVEAHKNFTSSSSKLKQVGTDVKLAGKAVLKVPVGMIDGVKTILNDWKSAGEDKKKEKMLKSGYRSKLLRNLRVAAMYGLAGYVSKLLIPIVWIARRASKTQDKRLRNEFTSELDAEIEVCKSKEEDAQSKGDEKQKYQLIRLRKQLERERERVNTNAKYI